jgi:anti-sigma regulatory factor (Ser/Thr protein kinase)
VTSLLVPHAPTSAALVRRALVDDLQSRDLPEQVVDDAVLVLSELVGNAVRHGSPLPGARVPDPAVRVSWWVAGGAVHLEVCDGGPGLPGDSGHERLGAVGRGETAAVDGTADLALGAPLAAEGGRGLPIIDLLTSRWGTTAPSPSGAVAVFAELPLPGVRPAALSRGAHDAPRTRWAQRTATFGAWTGPALSVIA